MIDHAPLDRRDLFRAVADSPLPVPVDVGTFELPGRQWASIRLDDNRPDLVDVWAAECGPEGGARAAFAAICRPGSDEAFRSYDVHVTFGGWPVEVSSHVDIAVAPVTPGEPCQVCDCGLDCSAHKETTEAPDDGAA